jgi:hypothetical protein
VEITLTTTGYAAWVDAMDAIERELHPAAERAVSRGLDEIQRSALVVLSRTSHEVGERTESPPGEPPAWVTGNLARSYEQHGPDWVTADVVEGTVGPTAIYARIQELGGDVYAINYPQLGNPEVGFFGDHVYIPARPYVEPVVDGAREEIAHIWHEEISRALEAG